jgi:ubiquinone/menaquinone biosynthesis C-methylase UbiE
MTTPFKELERSGWNERAATYDASVGDRTRAAVVQLADAVQAGPGMRVLDLCCGPGYSAAEAVARGAEAIGVDIAPGMVAEAARRVPNARFELGDAEALHFPDATFDGVVCAFGMLHLGDPERALAEVFRVLVPGGRFAWTVWHTGDRVPLSTLMQTAIRDHGAPGVALPAAPPRDLFGSETTAREALERAGFAGVTRTDVPITFRAASADAVWTSYTTSTVRTAAMLGLQPPDALARIEATVRAGLERWTGPDGIVAPNDAILYAARKPH